MESEAPGQGRRAELTSDLWRLTCLARRSFSGEGCPLFLKSSPTSKKSASKSVSRSMPVRLGSAADLSRHSHASAEGCQEKYEAFLQLV